MFQNDYLMRMILQLVEAIRRSMQHGYASREEEIQAIEAALGECMDLDPSLALNLAPDSLVSVLELGNFDSQLGGYVTRTLYYEADLLEAENKTQSASLRRAQASAIALKYAIDISSDAVSAEELEAFFAEQEEQKKPSGAGGTGGVQKGN